MSVTFVLLILLLFLMTMIGENRGLKSFLILVLNLCTFFLMLKSITAGINPIYATIAGCIILSSITYNYFIDI